MLTLALFGVAAIVVLAVPSKQLRLRLRLQLLLLLLLVMLLQHMRCRSDVPVKSQDREHVNTHDAVRPATDTGPEPFAPLNDGANKPQDSAPVTPTLQDCPPPYVGCTVP